VGGTDMRGACVHVSAWCVRAHAALSLQRARGWYKQPWRSCSMGAVAVSEEPAACTQGCTHAPQPSTRGRASGGEQAAAHMAAHAWCASRVVRNQSACAVPAECCAINARVLCLLCAVHSGSTGAVSSGTLRQCMCGAPRVLCHLGIVAAMHVEHVRCSTGAVSPGHVAAMHVRCSTGVVSPGRAAASMCGALQRHMTCSVGCMEAAHVLRRLYSKGTHGL
jgi:hypothetical protein